MGPRSESPRVEQPTYRFPPSPSSSTTPTRLSIDTTNRKDKPSSSYPVLNRTTPHKGSPGTKWPNDIYDSGSDGSGTETKQGRVSPHLYIRRKAARRKSDRALTLPSSRTAPVDLLHLQSPPGVGRPLSRRSSSASSSSSSNGPDWKAPQPSSSGIGRKVAASLDLFKESVTTPGKEEANPFEFARSGSSASRRKTSSQLEDVGEAQFEFVKRSDWPEREAAAVRREKSTTALERVRTRDSTTSVGSSRDAETRRRKDRQPSVRDTVMSDLVQWRKAVAAVQDDGRGRPRERPVWSEDKGEEMFIGSPGTDSSASSASTYQEKNDRTVPASPYRQPQSSTHRPHHSPRPHDHHDVEVTPVLPSSLFVNAPEHEIPPPATLRRDHSHSPIRLPSSFPLPERPSLPSLSSATPSFSTWSSDDDDDESTWETASITTSTSTTSASTPFPLSPSRTSPAPQPIVRHPSDEDYEHHEDVLSPYDDVTLGHNGAQSSIQDDEPIDWSLNLSQESLPHIPLRPFRNQVGGHSAIYKFTKRAVCKVSAFRYSCSKLYSDLLIASCVTGESVL